MELIILTPIKSFSYFKFDSHCLIFVCLLDELLTDFETLDSRRFNTPRKNEPLVVTEKTPQVGVPSLVVGRTTLEANSSRSR